MIRLLIPIIIWIIALVIMGLPKLVYRKIQKLKVELKIESELAKHSNPDESMYKSMEEGMLEMVHFRNLCFMSSNHRSSINGSWHCSLMCGFITWLKIQPPL